jgi:hypothetical protein
METNDIKPKFEREENKELKTKREKIRNRKRRRKES